MRRKTILLPAAFVVTSVIFSTSSALAAATFTCGWENGESTILGNYNDVSATNVADPDPVHEGTRSLKLVDGTASETAQAYIAWITGLQDGDTVTASYWAYDTTPSGSPSTRIWAHFNDDPEDVAGYNGSASGNSAYPAGDGWSELTYDWIIADGHTGLIIEARTYSVLGDTVWIDDLSVTIPSHASVVLPEDVIVEPSGIPGDANNDGIVDADDAARVAANWLARGATWAMGDFNEDTIVNEIDATILAANWQQSPVQPSVAVPEPTTFLLMFGGLFPVLFLYRRVR